MPKLFNLARMETSTTGTGTITLGSAIPSFLSFASAGVQSGDVVTYAIEDAANREIGRGTYTSSGTTLSRDTVLASTNGGAKISLSGSAQVFITAAAEDIGFNVGTRMLFQQSTAPTGWTKDTSSHNDKALRVVTGTAGSGGSSAFSTVFGKTATDNFTLTTSQMPNHTHTSGGQGNFWCELGGGLTLQVQYTGGTGSTTIGATAGSGSGGAHSHGMDIRVQYADVIIATKD